MNEFIFYRNQIPLAMPLNPEGFPEEPPKNMWKQDNDLPHWILYSLYPIVIPDDLQLLQPDGRTPAYPVEQYNVVDVDEHTCILCFILHPKATLIMPAKH
jgi:hypothetical protein